mgnify:CR=1 FL=1
MRCWQTSQTVTRLSEGTILEAGYPGVSTFAVPQGTAASHGFSAPEFFDGVAPGPSSLSPLFPRAIEAGKLFGLRLDGTWMHVGTPDAVKAAEAAMLVAS